MASNYTNEFSFYNGKRWARGYVEAWVSSETDTTATIYWRIVCQQKSAALYGQVANGYVDGSHVGYCQGYITSSSSSWKDVCSTSGYTTVNKTDSSRNVPVAISTRVQVVDGYGSVVTDWASATCYVPISGINYKAPYDPTGVTAVRESDNKNIILWEQDGTGMNGLYPWGGFYILRRTDGGELSQIADMANWEATSYNDTATSANHSYEYAVQTYGPGGTSEVVFAEGALYNTPAAPTKVTASRLAETTVKLKIANPANTAAELEIQRSADGETWETVATVEGSPVTEATDEPGGGTFYYRARNTRGTLVSAWSPASNAVVTVCAPAAPTLVAPASGTVVNKVRASVTFEHKHNPIDGSGQTAAQYRISTDDGATYTYHDIEGESEKLTLENTFAVNSKVTYAVRTKGAHADYGPWSGNRVFYVYQAPSIAFAQPSNGFKIRNTPIHVVLQYIDPSGKLANAMLTISDGSKVVYTRNMRTDVECDILASEWLPDNGKSYTLTVQARSSSSLSASATRKVSVDFTLPQPAALYIENDPETGYASLVVTMDESEPWPSSITWDGNTAGLETYGPTEGGGYWCRMLDVAVSSSDIVLQDAAYVTNVGETAASITGLPAGETVTELRIIPDQVTEGDGWYEISDTPVLVVTAPSVSYGGLKIPTGIYFFYADLTERYGDTYVAYTSSLTLPVIEYAEASSISIWRESEDGRVLLGEGLQAGAGLVDRYAPLNIGYQYIVSSFADSGAANSTTFNNLLATKWAFLYFAGGGIARGMWNPDDSWKMDQGVTYVHYIGREHPVAYMRDSMDETHNVAVMLKNRDEVREFRKMMATHEPVVAKLWDSLVFHAVPQLQGRPKATVGSYWGDVGVTLTRIDGEAL